MVVDTVPVEGYVIVDVETVQPRVVGVVAVFAVETNSRTKSCASGFGEKKANHCKNCNNACPADPGRRQHMILLSSIE